MNVLIVNPCARPDRRGYSSWSCDVGLAVASLLAAGHNPSVLNTSIYDEKELRRVHATSGARAVLVYTESWQSDQARAIGAFYAISFGKLPVFFFGPHASAWPADCLNAANGVLVLRGYVEHLLPRLLDSVAGAGDFFTMPGLSFPVLSRFYHNPIAAAPELSSRHLPDRELSGYTAFARGLEDSVGIEIETSRGEYNVSDRSQAWFDMSKPQTGLLPPFQQKSVAQVIEEAKVLRTLCPDAKFFGFRDDNCLAVPAWVIELCAAWKREIDMPFWVASRPEFLRESVFEALASGGCFRVHMSLESGADHIRRRVLGRRCADSHVLYAARACRRFRLALITVSEVGFPGETEDMIGDTIELNKRMRPDWAMCSEFHPVPGTAVYQRCENKHWLSPSAYGTLYDPNTTVRQPWIRPRKVEEYLASFNERIFGELQAAPTGAEA